MEGIHDMSKVNPNCKCPNLKCPNHGNCKDFSKYHHKGLPTYCKAEHVERAIRNIHAKLTGN